MNINEELIKLNKNKPQSWTITDNYLYKEFKFKDFITAFGFMTQVAIYAQEQDHHPEWSNCYNLVVIKLTTHSANKITEQDFNLAKKIDTIV